jgi:hypothetical protein
MRKHIFPALAHLHTLKLPTGSGPGLGRKGIAGLLADANIPDLSFVNQFFKFLPRGVRICG